MKSVSVSTVGQDGRSAEAPSDASSCVGDPTEVDAVCDHRWRVGSCEGRWFVAMIEVTEQAQAKRGPYEKRVIP